VGGEAGEGWGGREEGGEGAIWALQALACSSMSAV